MKLGLMDAVPAHRYLDGARTDAEWFRDLFASVDVTDEMPGYTVADGNFPASLNECDAWLITGSPCSVYEGHAWIAELENFIRDCHSAEKPLAGICFGHQLVAQALGGEVALAEQGWLLGLNDLEVTATRPWMEPPLSRGSLYFFNRDQVLSLPGGAERLASSPRCPNAMYTIGDHIFCLQAHPEHVAESIAGFLDMIAEDLTEQQYNEARESLRAGRPDAALFGRWTWQFLARAVSGRRGHD